MNKGFFILSERCHGYRKKVAFLDLPQQPTKKKYKLVDLFYVCVLLFGTTPENFRAKSTSCF